MNQNVVRDAGDFVSEDIHRVESLPKHPEKAVIGDGSGGRLVVSFSLQVMHKSPISQDPEVCQGSRSRDRFSGELSDHFLTNIQ